MSRVSVISFLLLSLAALPAAQSGTSAQQGAQGRAAGPGRAGQAVSPTSSQGPQRTEWWQREEIRTEIGLRKDQAAKIDEVYQAMMPRLRTSAEDRMKAEEQLAKLFSSITATEDDVVRQLNQVQAARNEVDRQRTLMLFRINRLLTPDQRTKLRAIYDRMDRERREGSSGRGDGPKPPQMNKQRQLG